MPPIRFQCRAIISGQPEDIARQILNLELWPTFGGYGPIPGIQAAEFETQTPNQVGTRIRVTNRDGSRHVEEIREWDPARKVVMEMKDFSPPLSTLAEGFTETWMLEGGGEETTVTRAFQLRPRVWWSWPLLWMISFFLKKAIARHLAQMKQGPPGGA